MEDILNGIVDAVVVPDVVADVYAGLNKRVIVSVGVDFVKRISGIIGLVIIIVVQCCNIGLSRRYDPVFPVAGLNPCAVTPYPIIVGVTGLPGIFRVAPI
jgi:hypothetical protein